MLIGGMSLVDPSQKDAPVPSLADPRVKCTFLASPQGVRSPLLQSNISAAIVSGAWKKCQCPAMILTGTLDDFLAPKGEDYSWRLAAYKEPIDDGSIRRYLAVLDGADHALGHGGMFLFKTNPFYVHLGALLGFLFFSAELTGDQNAVKILQDHGTLSILSVLTTDSK